MEPRRCRNVYAPRRCFSNWIWLVGEIFLKLPRSLYPLVLHGRIVSVNCVFTTSSDKKTNKHHAFQNRLQERTRASPFLTPRRTLIYRAEIYQAAHRAGFRNWHAARSFGCCRFILSCLCVFKVLNCHEFFSRAHAYLLFVYRVVLSTRPARFDSMTHVLGWENEKYYASGPWRNVATKSENHEKCWATLASTGTRRVAVTASRRRYKRWYTFVFGDETMRIHPRVSAKITSSPLGVCRSMQRQRSVSRGSISMFFSGVVSAFKVSQSPSRIDRKWDTGGT